MNITYVISEPYNMMFGDFDRSFFADKQARLEELWNRYGDKVVSFIEQETGATFTHPTYPCYLLQHCPVKGISKPLTLRVSERHMSNFITLLHELLHNLMSENKNIFDAVKKQLPHAEPFVIRHVIIFDILKKIIDKFFTPEIWERQQALAFKESFAILEKVGPLKY